MHRAVFLDRDGVINEVNADEDIPILNRPLMRIDDEFLRCTLIENGFHQIRRAT